MDPTYEDLVPVDGTLTADTGGFSFESFYNSIGNAFDSLNKPNSLLGQYMLNQQKINAQQSGLKMTSLGAGGYYYDGQTGTYRALPGTVGGMSGGTLLLIGAALVAVMLLKD